MIGKRLVLIAISVVAMFGCDDPTRPLPPPSGSAVVSLTTPYTDDGAVIIQVQGPGLTTMQPSDSSTLFYSRLVTDSVARIVAIGDLKAGAVFTFKVAAGQQFSAYTATLQQAATRNDSLRTSLSGYSLTISP